MLALPEAFQAYAILAFIVTLLYICLIIYLFIYVFIVVSFFFLRVRRVLFVPVWWDPVEELAAVGTSP